MRLFDAIQVLVTKISERSIVRQESFGQVQEDVTDIFSVPS